MKSKTLRSPLKNLSVPIHSTTEEQIQMAKNLTCADTAKLIRKSLKEAFADITFSVKSKTYSGGASIRVNWIDGPNAAQVEAVVSRFSGAYFDGMQDLKGSKYHMMDGIEVSFGADYLFCERSYSVEAIDKAIARVFRHFAGNFASVNMTPPPATDYQSGSLRCVQIPGLGAHHDRDLQYYVRAALSKNSDRMSAGKSPTAGKIFQTRTDGHGQSSFDTIKATL